MSEAVKKDNKLDKRERPEEVKKPDKSVQPRHDFAKGLVVFDNIRKEINKYERKLEKIRDERYDYLSGEYLRKVLAEECENVGIPVDTFEGKSPENFNEKSPIALKASPVPVPKTSSAMVGWRSSRLEYDLEFVGPLHVSAKNTIEPPFVPGEFRVTEQKISGYEKKDPKPERVSATNQF